MVTGRLTIKRDYWYVVLELKRDNGKRYSKWIGTGLKTPGNKRQALDFLDQKRLEFTQICDLHKRAQGISFADYMKKWLAGRKGEVAPATYLSYSRSVDVIVNYFHRFGIRLSELKAHHIMEFYQYNYNRGVSGNTVLHYHANIHHALKTAMQNDLILTNPAAIVRRPRKSTYITPEPYSIEENKILVEKIQGDSLELPVLLSLYTGLRRSEVLGLKWESINFNNNTITICNSIKRVLVDGRKEIASIPQLKRQSSHRTLPIPEAIREYLLKALKRRFVNYPINMEEHLCINKKGSVLKPDALSNGFRKLQDKYNLRRIRFHDLRHGCANMLISERVPLIEVQQWMGHSSILTTADIYSHLTFDTKLKCVDVINKKLGGL